jgi:hypothetical protein
VDFDKEIRPILAAQCAECHSERAKSSGFSVASEKSVLDGGSKHGRSVVPGHPERSPLVRTLKGEIAPKMPLGREIAAADLARVERWIREMPESAGPAAVQWRWPFEKPLKHAPPAVRRPDWLRNPIDAFVLSRLESEGLAPAPPAPPRVLARRVYMDLVGVPPTPEELAAFLVDTAPDAYARLVDRLLMDPRYGERWGRHWLDLVRYGETSGLEGDGSIGNAWRFRDWVVRAFNADMPYDKFVTLQLGGADEHSQTRNNYPIDAQGHVPLGFFRVAPWDRSNLVADEVRQNYLSEVATATGSIFLGLSLGCARCHDHKYDPISQRDYYRVQAFFNTIQADNVDVPYAEPDFAARADQQIKRYQALLKDGPEKVELDRLERDLLPKLVAARKKSALGKAISKEDLRLEMRRGDASLFPRGVREKHASALEEANRTQDPEERAALDAYERDLLAHHTELPIARFDSLGVDEVRAEAGKQKSTVFTDSERSRHAELAAKLEVYRRRLGRWQNSALTVRNVPGPPNGPFLAPTRVLKRGDYRQPGDAVEPGFPSAFTQGAEEAAELITDRYRQFPTRGWRLTLARWIASRDNPQSARVMANRVWQHHFGRGIVATPSDFGRNGERPTHPELLDWLAVEFMDRGWSVKALHRLMLTSATYMQSSDNRAHAANTRDPDNRLLWRFERRRLEAEALRDSILAASGRLNPEMYGPSMFPALPEDLADFARYGRTGGLMWEPNDRDEDARRRSVYIFQRRSLPLPMMASFDATVFSESCDRRSSTTTPLQALTMMNGNLVHDESDHLARRVEREAGPGRRAQVARAFEIVLGRSAGAEELDRFDSFGGSMAAIGRVLFNSNEFLYVD